VNEEREDSDEEAVDIVVEEMEEGILEEEMTANEEGILEQKVLNEGKEEKVDILEEVEEDIEEMIVHELVLLVEKVDITGHLDEILDTIHIHKEVNSSKKNPMNLFMGFSF